MNNIAISQSLFIIGTMCLAGSVASLLVLLVKIFYKKKILLFGNNHFVWLCVLLSGFLVCMALFLCTSTWRQFLYEFFVDNVSFYIIVMVVAFVMVVFSRYLIIPLCILYVLYVGLAFFVFHSECMEADSSFSVVTMQKNEENVQDQITIDYVTVSPNLLLPFSQTWIVKIRGTFNTGTHFDRKKSTSLINCLSNFLFSHVTQKTLRVDVPTPKIPPESWKITLSTQNSVLQANLKRIF